MFRFAIVEDEEAAANGLSACINRYCKQRDIKADITIFQNATELLKKYTPVYDIIFMDIMLPYLNGMDAAKQLRKIDETVMLIFVTNMVNFAVKGYEVDALDFIIKPVVYDSFAMRMNKAMRILQAREGVTVTVSSGGVTKVLPSCKIHYVEVDRHNIIYHTEEGRFTARGVLTEVEKSLAGENFVRCNMCYLVNLKYVTEVRDETVKVASDILKISRPRKKEFMSALTNYYGMRGKMDV